MTNQAYVEELSNGQLISVARMAKRSVWKNTKFMKLLYCELRCRRLFRKAFPLGKEERNLRGRLYRFFRGTMVKENIYKRLSADVDRVYGKKVVRNMRRFVISDPEGWYTSMATTFFDLGI